MVAVQVPEQVPATYFQIINQEQSVMTDTQSSKKQIVKHSVTTSLKNRLASTLKIMAVSTTAVIVLSGCVEALVAGAVIATIDVIHDRRTVGEYIDDSAIEITARNILVSRPEIQRATHVKPTSWNGILLLTGEIDSQNIKQELMERFANIQGVRQVVDETTITNKTGFGTRTNDTWITSKVKSRLLLKTGLDANRVKVTTTRGSVYLMGIVTRDEADTATELSRSVRGVERVVRVFEYNDDY